MRREHGQLYSGTRYNSPDSVCLSRASFNMAAVPGDARARFWYLAASFGFLLVETTVTLVRKQGKEWKW